MFDLSDTESRSVGIVPLRVTIENRIYEFDFHVLKGYRQSMPHDGLLGTDHLKSTRSIINYDTLKLEMTLYDEEFPLFYAYELEPRSRAVLTIGTNPTQLTEGIIDVPIEDPDIRIPPEINSISNNRTSIMAINQSEETKILILPHIEVTEPSQILIIQRISDKSTNCTELLRKTIDLQHLTNNEREQLLKLIESFAEIFFLPGDKLESQVQHYHKICTKENASPIYVKNYRFLEIHKNEVETQVHT